MSQQQQQLFQPAMPYTKLPGNTPKTESNFSAPGQSSSTESTDAGELATLRLMILQRDFIIKNYYQTILALQSQIHALTSGSNVNLPGNVDENSSGFIGFASNQDTPMASYPFPTQPQSFFQSSFNSAPQKKSPPSSPQNRASSETRSREERKQASEIPPENKLFDGKYAEYIANLRSICSECGLHGRLKSKKKPLVDSLLLLSFFKEGVIKNENGGYQIEDENATREKMNSISVLIRPPSRGTNHSYENWKRAMGKTFKKDGNTFTPKDENSRRYINHVEEHLKRIRTAKQLAEASMELEK